MRPVIWPVEVRQGFLSIVDYIALDNPAAATRVRSAIFDAADRLGEISTGRPGRVFGTYEKSLVRYPYIILYEIRPIAGQDSVVVLAIVHTAQDWRKGEWPKRP